MKLWTAEQTARRMVVGLGLFGLLTVGLGLFMQDVANGIDRHSFLGVSYAIINSGFLVQSVGLALYLKYRGRKGVLILRLCCAVSVAVAIGVGFLAREEFGGLVWAVAPMPVLSAALAHALATRRIEVGDPSPLMPGAADLAKMTWKQALAIFAICAVLYALMCLVFGKQPVSRPRCEPSAAPREPLEGDSMRDFANLDWDEEHGF